jgi:hypothetical protein
MTHRDSDKHTRGITFGSFQLILGMRIVVQKIDVEDVIQYDKLRYNTNNHWNIVTEGTRPEDYYQRLDENNTKFWIDHFKKYSKLEISLLGEERWLLEANEMGRQTARFPLTFQEERDNLIQKLNSQFQFSSQQYFVRTENVSLKCGQHGTGPYESMKEVIESLVTCVDGHTPIRSDMESVTLYFIPWTTINPAAEYRVFICEGKMTAISQQHCYTVYPEYDRTRDVELIYRYFKRKIQPVIPHQSYSIDIAVLDHPQSAGTQPVFGEPSGDKDEDVEDAFVYFIEVNCFGKEYAAGSSLFGWLQDEDILYGRKRYRACGVEQGEGEGEEDVIYLRYTVRGNPPAETQEISAENCA